MVVWQVPYLQLTQLSCVHIADFCVAVDVACLLCRDRTLARHPRQVDECLIERWPLVLCLQLVDGVRVEDEVTAVAECLHLVNGSLRSHVGMRLVLVALIAIPVDSLEGSSELPDAPEELSCLTESRWACALVAVLP